MLSSAHHVEMNPSDAGFQDRYVVQEVIKEMAKNRPIDAKGKRAFKGRSVPCQFLVCAPTVLCWLLLLVECPICCSGTKTNNSMCVQSSFNYDIIDGTQIV